MEETTSELRLQYIERRLDDLHKRVQFLELSKKKRRLVKKIRALRYEYALPKI